MRREDVYFQLGIKNSGVRSTLRLDPPLQASFTQQKSKSQHHISVLEIIHFITSLKSKLCSIAIKIDHKYVYDRSEWSFIIQTLLKGICLTMALLCCRIYVEH